MKGHIKNKQPLISVVMPVYNAGNFIEEAAKSILNQSYKNIEFIIVDDNSTDGSFEILKKLAKQDKRIKLLRNEKNLGVSNTVRIAIEKARGDFIARMDADDISYYRRLEKQINYLLTSPDVVAVGAQCQLINEKGNIIGKKSFPVEYKEIYSYIFEFVPLQQPTLMIARKRLPYDFEFYKDGMNTAEEIELIFKLFKYGKVENLPETLLKYRIHSKNTSFQNIKTTFFLTLLSRVKAIFEYGYKPTLRGIFVTFCEAILVVILPKNILLSLYSKARHLSTQKELLIDKLTFVKTKALAFQSLL